MCRMLFAAAFLLTGVCFAADEVPAEKPATPELPAMDSLDGVELPPADDTELEDLLKNPLGNDSNVPPSDEPAPETPAQEAPAPEVPAETPPAPTPEAGELPASEDLFAPAPETPAAETPALETPPLETPPLETPAPETPAVETPAPEVPTSETPATLLDAPEGLPTTPDLGESPATSPEPASALPEPATALPEPASVLESPEAKPEEPALLDIPRQLPPAAESTSLGDKNTPQKSAARDLLPLLVKVPDNVLEGVERVSLATFLEKYPGDAEQLRKAISFFWQCATVQSEVSYWAKRHDVLKQLTPAGPTEQPLYQAALSQAQTARADAMVSMRASSVELGRLAGSQQELWPETLPHAGSYSTNYTAGAGSYYYGSAYGVADPGFLDKRIGLRYEQLSNAAAAYRSSEYILQEMLKNRATLGVVLQAMDSVNERRDRFFDILEAYNRDILDYVLQVSSKRGEDLARLLVRMPPKVPTDNYTIPSLAAPMPLTPADPKDKPAVEEKTFETAPAPGTDEKEKTSALSTTPSPLPEPEIPTLPPEPEVPGAASAVPPVETAPPSSDFQPIGGESGSTSTLPPIAPLPIPNPGDSGSVNRPTPFRLVAETLPEGTASRPKELSLGDHLAQAGFSDRQEAARSYWRYAVIQAQRQILDHQRKMLDIIGGRILNASTESDASLERMGLHMEKAVFSLKTDQLGLEIAAWNEWYAMNPQHFSSPEPPVLPLATTRPKTGDFRFALDRLTPGSEEHRRAVALARQLDYCAGELQTANDAIEKILPYLFPTDDADTQKTLDGVTYAGYVAFFDTLERSREASTHYLRLVYAVDSSLVACVFSETPNITNTELVERLTR